MKTIEFTEILGWKFEIDEISAGVYKVTGKDNCDRRVEKIGFDVNVLLEECKKSASQFVGKKQ
jgi:hypothetical protein